MLSARYLASISDDAVAIYKQLEYELITDMARRLAEIGKADDNLRYQAIIAEELGGLRIKAIELLKKYDKKGLAEIKAALEAALKEAFSADKVHVETLLDELSENQRQAFEATAKKMHAAPIIQKKDDVIKIFSGLQRLTSTIADTAQADFISEANAAYMRVATGAFDYGTSMQMAIDSLAGKGVRTVSYTDSGKQVYRSIESAVRANVLTGIAQTANQQTLDNCQTLGVDLVEVSAHKGARPEHAAWQGKVYSLSGDSDKYPSFYKVCKPGTPEGIGGVNYRHSYYPYIEGTKPLYSNGALDEMRDDTVQFKGEEVTRYEAEQIQRAIERRIRDLKLRIGAAEAAGLDASKNRKKLAKVNGIMREFLDETGLHRDRVREYVGRA